MGCAASKDLTHLIEHRQFGTMAMSKLKLIERAAVSSDGHTADRLMAARTHNQPPCSIEPNPYGSREMISRNRSICARDASGTSARGWRRSTNFRPIPSLVKKNDISALEIAGNYEHDPWFIMRHHSFRSTEYSTTCYPDPRGFLNNPPTSENRAAHYCI